MESYHTLLTKLPTTTSVYIYITNYWKRLTPFTRPFYFIFAIYSLAMLSIWRANFSYMDDLKRALEGYAWSHDFNRYSSSWLAYALNANDVLSDISPFSQIIALVILSAASVIIAYVFCKRKIEYLPLVLSAFIGLIPFMLGCWVFKFDAPGIALSILASVVPFLFFAQPEVKFTKKTLLFGFLSVFCLMIMWTSYQASSGIYLVVVLGWTLNAFLERINVRKIINQVGIFIGIYIVSILTYKIFFPDINGAGYRQTELFPLSEIATGIFHNIQNLLTTLRTSLHPEWTYLVMLMAICFMITLVIRGKYSKLGSLANLFAGMLFIITSIPLSYGAYLVLQDAPIEGRSLVGVGFILAIMAIITVKNLCGLWRCILVVPSLILLYSFMVFAWAFGNGLADQERYGNFRLEMLLGDLARIYTTSEQVSITKLQLRGDIGESPVMQHVHLHYPVVGKIFDSGQQSGLSGNGAHGSRKTRSYYGWNQAYVGFWTKKGKLWDCENMRTEIDTYYHTIKSDNDGQVCVLIKVTPKLSSRID